MNESDFIFVSNQLINYRCKNVLKQNLGMVVHILILQIRQKRKKQQKIQKKKVINVFNMR